ncbi:hypothetical protein ACN38_g7533 [Penicillium nordicum]|uniref:Uncharacterized protein n=1 Tax=Penicillium nordicum TaxID=229535 RepID=A0A0M9WEC1_9EURO|nr:hypothetical protein ACN38_g7533 [Penicillium nordicum]
MQGFIYPANHQNIAQLQITNSKQKKAQSVANNLHGFLSLASLYSTSSISYSHFYHLQKHLSTNPSHPLLISYYLSLMLKVKCLMSSQACKPNEP